MNFNKHIFAVVIAGHLLAILPISAATAAKSTQQNTIQTDVFVSGADGYHTYRMPAMVVNDRGTILAFCEGRKFSGRDKSPTDMVVKRGFDNVCAGEFPIGEDTVNVENLSKIHLNPDRAAVIGGPAGLVTVVNRQRRREVRTVVPNAACADRLICCNIAVI